MPSQEEIDRLAVDFQISSDRGSLSCYPFPTGSRTSVPRRRAVSWLFRDAFARIRERVCSDALAQGKVKLVLALLESRWGPGPAYA